jgi:hypothetical protein
MSHACIAMLLATTLAGPEAPPASPAPVPVEAAVASLAPEAAPAPAPATTTTTTTTTVVLPVAPLAPAAVGPAPTGQPMPTPEPAPTPAAAPTAVAAPTLAPTPPPPDPERARAQRVANDLAAAGGAVLGLGAATLLLVTWPAHATYQRSLERAEDARWVTEREPHIEQAERRRAVMQVSAGIGAGLAVAGTVMLATGLSRRARLRHTPAATLSVAPAVGGGLYGAGASLRF